MTNDFFVNLSRHGYRVEAVETDENVYDGVDRVTGDPKYTATAVDLVFGSNSQLRALAEVYASADANQKFAEDFAAAWTKVMDLDRFDVN